MSRSSAGIILHCSIGNCSQCSHYIFAVFPLTETWAFALLRFSFACFCFSQLLSNDQMSLAQTQYHPLARRDAPAEDRRPEGEGANIDRRLVPYHGKCRRIQSRIEFIYLYIYIYVRYTVLFVTACGVWVLGKRLTKAITKVQKAARQK